MVWLRSSDVRKPHFNTDSVGLNRWVGRRLTVPEQPALSRLQQAQRDKKELCEAPVYEDEVAFCNWKFLTKEAYDASKNSPKKKVVSAPAK
jgi:hypothetical protein